MLWGIIFILVLLIPILSIVLDSQVGQALAARLERKEIGGGDDSSAQRIALLEGEVDRLGQEVERLSEESQFLHKLLSGRPAGRESLPPGDPGE